MSYSKLPLNLSDSINLFKPKPRYMSSEERNSNGSPSPPRSSSDIQHASCSSNYYKQFDYPQYSYLMGMEPFPHQFALEGDPIRLSSSIIPYNFDYAAPHIPTLRTPLPAIVNASHYNYHTHPYFHLKMAPYMSGYDPYLCSDLRRPKRIRTAFSPNQLLTLEKAFEKNHYVVGTERKQLAQILGLSETQVKVWFQNRRTKHKRQKQDGQCCNQKNGDKDCLDCREHSAGDESSSDEYEAVSPGEAEKPFYESASPSDAVKTCNDEGNTSDNCTTTRKIWNPIEIQEKNQLQPVASN